MPESTQIKLFQDSKIRSIWNEEEQQWYFSVVDVIEVLTESPTPRQYWGKIKDREYRFRYRKSAFACKKSRRVRRRAVEKR